MRPPFKRWTSEEDRTLSEMYPDYAAIQAALPHRTPAAVRRRAVDLGVVRRLIRWTNVGVRTVLRERAAGLSYAEIVEKHFPGASEKSVNNVGLRSGAVMLEARTSRLSVIVRRRARAVGMTLPELDRRARSKGVFQCRGGADVGIKHIAAAVAVLGGELDVEWND